MKTICERCQGMGFFADHSPSHYANSNSTCYEHGCPVQVECQECKGTGKAEVPESETELFNQILKIRNEDV